LLSLKLLRRIKKTNSYRTNTGGIKIKLLQTDPYYPSLQTKKIKGFQDLFKCSVNMDIRIFWKYEGADIIITLDIGHHSIVDKL